MAKRIGIVGAGKPSAIGLAAKILSYQSTGVVHPASSGLLAKDGGVHEIGKLSGAEMYEQIKDFIDTLPDKIVQDSNHLKYPALASSFHEFKSPALAEAYQDSDLTPVGAGYLDEIAALKDQLLTEGISIHVPRLAPNKSGYYYLSKLSRDVRKAFVKNTVWENKNLIPLTAVLRSDYADMEDFIAFPFVWTDTPEGYEYWSIISTEARWNSNQNLKA